MRLYSRNGANVRIADVLVLDEQRLWSYWGDCCCRRPDTLPALAFSFGACSCNDSEIRTPVSHLRLRRLFAVGKYNARVELSTSSPKVELLAKASKRRKYQKCRPA